LEGDAERGIAVQDCNTALELRDPSIEVAHNEALTHEFDAVHSRLCTASAVASGSVTALGETGSKKSAGGF
jgi:hypothetical protein